MRATSLASAVGVVGAMLVAGFATAVAADDGGATTLAVSATPALRTGSNAPVSVAGVPAIRRARAIPPGYTLTGQTVQTTPGGPIAGAALTMRCPGSKRLRGLAATGDVGFAVADRKYSGRRQTLVTTYSLSKPGVTHGTVYAACR